MLNKVNAICMCLYRYMYVRMQIISVVSYIILVLCDRIYSGTV